jgi:hypothetical protein
MKPHAPFLSSCEKAPSKVIFKMSIGGGVQADFNLASLFYFFCAYRLISYLKAWAL